MHETITDWPAWEQRFAGLIEQTSAAADPAHDPAHIERVVRTARRLAAVEGARMEVVIPAAWLHDCVVVPKDAPERRQASRMAAERAVGWLQEAGYPAAYLPAIAHAIAAHSFSARIPPETIEARVVQDADRLDALGAIGIARCLMLGGALGRPLYHPDEPLPRHRPPDDGRYTLDHFYAKLLTLADTMQTPSGRAEARRRTRHMQAFLEQLASEVTD